jgi:hypothetical protein
MAQSVLNRRQEDIMRYQDYEQESGETFDELSDAFETELGMDGAFETETESLDMELTDFETDETSAVRRGPRATAAGAASLQSRIARQRAALAQLKNAVERVGAHVRKDGARLRFTLPVRTVRDASSRLGLNPALVTALLKSMKKTNERPMPSRRELDTEMDEATMWEEVSGSCPGVTKVTTHWWGTALWLNECHTKSLTEAAGAGTGAAALCVAVAPHPAAKTICGIAAAIIAIGAGAIKAIDAMGGNKGIIIRKPWVVPPGLPPIVIWHQ